MIYIAFDKKPLTRLERINNVKKRDFLKYEIKARQVIEAILEKYSDNGILIWGSVDTKFRSYKQLDTSEIEIFGGKKFI